MAGLTREQRAAKAAEAEKTEAAKAVSVPDVDLIAMTKDRETLDVHPTCVKSHIAVGWTLVEG